MLAENANKLRAYKESNKAVTKKDLIEITGYDKRLTHPKYTVKSLQMGGDNKSYIRVTLIPYLRKRSTPLFRSSQGGSMATAANATKPGREKALSNLTVGDTVYYQRDRVNGWNEAAVTACNEDGTYTVGNGRHTVPGGELRLTRPQGEGVIHTVRRRRRVLERLLRYENHYSSGAEGYPPKCPSYSA